MKKEASKDISKMNISLREVASLIVTIIIGMFYVSQTYVTKAEAEEQKKNLQANFDGLKEDQQLKYEQLEKRISTMQDNTNSIARDVSYIRGKLEQKTR